MLVALKRDTVKFLPGVEVTAFPSYSVSFGGKLRSLQCCLVDSRLENRQRGFCVLLPSASKSRLRSNRMLEGFSSGFAGSLSLVQVKLSFRKSCCRILALERVAKTALSSPCVLVGGFPLLKVAWQWRYVCARVHVFGEDVPRSLSPSAWPPAAANPAWPAWVGLRGIAVALPAAFWVMDLLAASY